MYRLLLLLLFYSFYNFNNSYAKNTWTLVYKSLETNHYIDVKSINVSNKFRTAWGMYDHRKLNPETQVMSARYNKEFDCLRNRERVLSILFYSFSMGAGYPIGSRSISKWKKVPSNSIANVILLYVCSY